MLKKVCFFLTLSCNGAMRDPFALPQRSNAITCKAVVQLDDTDKRCALISVQGKEYTVRVGDTVGAYTVATILPNGLALKHEKENELKVITQ